MSGLYRIRCGVEMFTEGEGAGRGQLVASENRMRLILRVPPQRSVTPPIQHLLLIFQTAGDRYGVTIYPHGVDLSSEYEESFARAFSAYPFVYQTFR